LEIQCVSSIGTIASSYREIPSSYKNAIKLLNYQLIYGASQVYASDDYAEAVKDNHSLPELFEKMVSYIKACDRDGVTRYIDSIFEGFQTPNYVIDPSTIKYEVIHLISHILNEAAALRFSAYYLQAVRESMYKKLQATSTSDQLQKLLTDFSLDLIRQIEALRQNKYSPTVKQVVEYIQEKYSDYNISLKTLGDMLSVNPAYLGRIFRQATKEFFSDYLANIRVMKAKELLLTTNMKTNEIAKLVGFSSPSYFYTAFKKITGRKPSEIRK
jgi:two-component system response regulator YesN